MSGPIQTVKNGGSKAAVWLKTVQPYLTLLLTLVVIPSGLYLWNHGLHHRVIEDFMKQGGRVYSSTGEPISTDQLLQFVEHMIDVKTPSDEVVQALAGLKVGQDALRSEVSDLGKDVARLEVKQESLRELVIRLSK